MTVRDWIDKWGGKDKKERRFTRTASLDSSKWKFKRN
jgi:hypothetical protein